MGLLLYLPKKDGSGERITQVIQEVASGEEVEIFNSISDLSCRLRQPNHGLTIAVLHAGSNEDLLDLVAIRNLILDIRIILILPDREENTIAKGHILRPRIISYPDSDFKEVSAVLSKLVRNS